MQWFCRATCLSSSFHKQLWDNNTELFYRDGSYVGKGVFWARANGWAITAMVNAIRFAKNPAHLKVYTEIFKQLAIELASLQGADGAWRASLLNATGFPSPETTGTANFVYSMAYGVRVGLLDSTTYLPVVEKGWQWLSTTALQPSGLVGYCQPVGASLAPRRSFQPRPQTSASGNSSWRQPRCRSWPCSAGHAMPF